MILLVSVVMAQMADLVNTQKDLELCWTAKMAEFESRLNAVTAPTNPTVTHLREEFLAFKDLVTKMIHVLGQQVRDNAIALDAIEMRSRQKILILNGIPHDPDGEVEVKVLDLIQNKMGLTQVTSSSLKRCHRLGTASNDYPRSVLVHFWDHRIKKEVWSSKSKLKGTSVSLAEFLTKPRLRVHKRARTHFGMRSVWTLDGSIYIKLPGGGRVKISTEEELEPLIVKYPVTGCTTGPESDSVIVKDGQSCNKPISKHQLQLLKQSLLAGVPLDDPKRSKRPPAKKEISLSK